MIKDSKIFISGGTGSLGKELARVLSHSNEIVVYSRNEERQYHMQQEFPDAPMTFVIGDVRDQETMENAMTGCDIAIHAAAMKDLIMCEAQPTQTYLNNILGSKAFINAVKRTPTITKACGVSTDKAASPSNVYGCSKYIMEQLFREADQYSDCTFSAVRFGNMADSTGSLISAWKEDPQKEVKLTHPEVARFFFSVNDAAMTVIRSVELATGGEVMIKKMKKARIYDILRLITGKDEFEIMGLFPGEKIHEHLVSASEAPYTWDEGEYYVVRPGQLNPDAPDMFSTENAEPFTDDELKALIGLA